MNNKKSTGRFALILGLTVAAFPAAAADDAADYRHHVMEAVGGHMQSAVDILRQKVPHQAHLRIHATALAELAEISPALFPPGSEGGDALPVIWEQPDDFRVRLDDFQQAARAFQTAVEASDGVGPALQTLGQACKGCHDDYREE